MLHEPIGEVEYLNMFGVSGAEARLDLEDASRVGSDDNGSAGTKDVLHLPLLEPRRHGRFGEIVTARTAAADIRFI